MTADSRLPTAHPLRILLTAFLGALVAAGAWSQPTPVPGLSSPAFAVEDSDGIAHICGSTMHDAVLLQGYLDARDRFFQMDLLRRQFSGDLAELLGEGALGSDVQLRTLGLRRAAEESLAGYAGLAAEGSDTFELLEAYAQGVNLYLSEGPLPPEYGALELTSVREWTPVDSVVIGKGLAFGLSFDLVDLELTTKLAAYTEAGTAGGFDGTALLFEDTHRSAPFDPTVSIPSSAPTGAGAASQVARRTSDPDPRAVALAERYRSEIADIPLLEKALEQRGDDTGSNWWILSGSVTESGLPILANDPHLGLDTPAIFHETHLLASADPRCGIPEPGGSEVRSVSSTSRDAQADPGQEVNVNGVGFAGVPGVVLGCNQRLCWGATTNPMDVTDIYLEELVVDPATGLPTHTMFRGEMEPVVVIPQTFLVNQVGDDEPDNLVEAPIGPLEGGLTILVPRRNMGPLVTVDASGPDVTGLSVQYTGWRATFELEAFLRWNRSGNLEEFIEGLQFFDVGSQNWAYADVDGNVAYFTSAEMPVREDLQTIGAPDGGIPPFLIRDGTGALRHEWMPVENPQPHQALDFEIYSFTEMPQVVDPAAGYVVNANNDPVGTTLDNDPLNQLRPDGGIYYLSPGYAGGFRAGRIDRLVQDLLAEDGGISRAEVEAMQGNNQLLDAEVLVPFLRAAFDRAIQPGAPSVLRDLADDPRVAEAVTRLRTWDFSTPTGIPEAYDPGDDPSALPDPGSDEIERSVAATLWSVFRGQLIQDVVDRTLSEVGLGSFRPGSRGAMSAIAHHLQSFDTNRGVGASGVDFFAVDDGLTPDQARDLVLLRSVRAALDLLAGDPFGAAFGGSTELEDYRWGRLHRIIFDHPLGDPFEIPEAAGFTDLAPELPGVSRAGGFGAVDASSHSARADGVNEFMFGSGPARRFVGALDPDGIDAEQILPGGQSGVLGSPHYASQLPRWLTNRYHPLLLTPESVGDAAVDERAFTPPPCDPSPTSLCLVNDRFRVEAEWSIPGMASGPGFVADTPTDQSGNFYFFDEGNWELLVKVIDGCSFGGHFWVFGGSATDIGWELIVTDTRTGMTKSYSNAFGNAAPAITDTTAFGTCP